MTAKAHIDEFETFLHEQRDTAARAYVNGDPDPVDAIATHSSPATFFGPHGGSVVGAHEVTETYRRDAKSFAPGSESQFEILQQAASNDLAFWTGWQRAEVHVRGKSEPVHMDLRVTEVFRREGGDWKLVHRHADTLAAESGPEK